jgi:hypothetical protein
MLNRRHTKYKINAHASAGKVMVSVFWCSEGILLVEFVKRGAKSVQNDTWRHHRSENDELERLGQKGR